VCFNTSTRFNIGYNLVVHRFAPTTDEHQAEQLSTILHEWSSGVLEEFSIKVMLDVLTSTSNSGSDVKRILDILINA
jgi:6-phosphogluconate dehydrogenase